MRNKIPSCGNSALTKTKSDLSYFELSYVFWEHNDSVGPGTTVAGKMPDSHSDDSSRVAQILCKFAALFFSFYLHSDFLNHMSVEKKTGSKLAPRHTDIQCFS